MPLSFDTNVAKTHPARSGPSVRACGVVLVGYLMMRSPLHATIEEFAADGYTHVDASALAVG
jgi:hypothetical protein